MPYFPYFDSLLKYLTCRECSPWLRSGFRTGPPGCGRSHAWCLFMIPLDALLTIVARRLSQLHLPPWWLSVPGFLTNEELSWELGPIRDGHLNWIKLLRRNPGLGAWAEPEKRMESGAWWVTGLATALTGTWGGSPALLTLSLSLTNMIQHNMKLKVKYCANLSTQ